MESRADRLRKARIARGYATAAAAAEAFGWNPNTYSSNENGNAPFSYKKAKEYASAFVVRPEWLYDGQGTMRGGMAPVIGKVGANPDGSVLLATGQAGGDLVPLPPGGTDKAVALEVSGHSMRGLADDGSLIYFEDQRTPPSPDMLGHVVVLETDGDEVLVKRLLRGDKAGRFDLESLAGPTLRNQKLRWAAHITAIVPPHQAQRVLRRSAA